ncbi:MAG: phosphotransferase [Deltaproteobacteria bacterium]|nr:phosphotransferase [Deltaproteobacteria bacterium]MBI3387605.1 phosphotransferase [Deltaproteobacteria bacterium]
MPDEQAIRILLIECFGANADVEAIVPLAGDASTRRYVRARLRGAGVPASAVVMILADSGQSISSDELAVFKTPPHELPFVTVHRLLAALRVRVPAIYLDAGRRGFLVLEDVGDMALWDFIQDLPPAQIVTWYQRAIDQLLTIVLDGTRRRDDDHVAFQQAFDERLFNWEFEHFIEYALEKRLPNPVPPAELGELRRHFGAIAADLGAAPRFLAHRDFHSWNLFVHDARLWVIDFQDALLAPATYDLGTLLGDRDTPLKITPAVEDQLLDYYHGQWQARGGPAWSRDALRAQYFACALQKAFKVVGRFHYLNMVKGKPGYLRYLPSTLRQLRRLLARDPALSSVQTILAQHFPELRD